jgi:outer membrane protein assembly factor BamB
MNSRRIGALGLAMAVQLALALLVGSTQALAQTIAVSPGSGHPSGSISVSGSGFAASETVDIYFDATNLLVTAASATGDLAPSAIIVPATALPGRHAISVVGQTAGDTAQQTFNVNTNWAMFGFAASGTRYNPYENVIGTGNAAQLAVAWQVQKLSTVWGSSSPTVANGVAYFASDRFLNAFNAATGVPLWTRSIGGHIWSTPSVANGTAYVGSNVTANHVPNYLYALNAKTGVQLWRSQAVGPIGTCSPVVVSGLVYVGSSDHKLYAFNATTGALVWGRTLGSFLSSAPALANGVVYIGSNNGDLHAFNASTGATLWTVALGGSVRFTPAVAKGVVYVGTLQSKLYALNASTGAQRWVAAPAGLRVSGNPAVANGRVYVGSNDGKLYAFDAVTGALRWSSVVGDDIEISGPAVANGVVYEASYHGNLRAFDAITGALLWSAATDEGTTSSPAVANGVVYAVTFDGKLYAFALNGKIGPASKPKLTAPMP